ncbi:2Fe-2S iron-sulfur cluster-binding protein [Herbaspirillum seropedicae]|uniref:2Fe-2S iron-sulfur cluster-binding protein n=1 Tax=Herbaspirillum seropedicae TaxID=964 RepID=UPI00285653A2|nr:2Fe-2S iron-sulfur cluster-binding protein [Herbaspirillum seropedicae]MDR6397518.1 2Fe-2S ferredoxin [Herbaspirillum seropedicae]
MTTVQFTSFEGKVTTINGQPGQSVMQVAVQNGIEAMGGECGGVLSCATCHVFVDKDDYAKLPPMSPQENEMLDGTAIDREQYSRLACQIKLDDSLELLRVTTPEYQE